LLAIYRTEDAQMTDHRRIL